MLTFSATSHPAPGLPSPLDCSPFAFMAPGLWPTLTPPSPALKFGIDQILQQQELRGKKDQSSPEPLPSIAEYLRPPLQPWDLGLRHPSCWLDCCPPPPPPPPPPPCFLPFPQPQAVTKLSRRFPSSGGSGGGRKCEKCACPYCLDGAKQRQFALAGVKKLHACHLCEKTFQKTSHLRAHINGHNGVRPFVCTWPGCGKSFTRSDELQRHWRTHSGVKHFVCEVCDKGFTRSDHLKKHRRTHALSKDEEAGGTSPERSSSSSSTAQPVHGTEEESEAEEYIDVMD